MVARILTRNFVSSIAVAILVGTLARGVIAAPRHVATILPPKGLETAEALLEDLSFRNLELHDRAVLERGAMRSQHGGKLASRVLNVEDSRKVTGGKAAKCLPSNARYAGYFLPFAVRVKATHSTMDHRGGGLLIPTAHGRSGHALPPARDLASYIRLLLHYASGAVVTGRFYDWRNTSVYRATAGLHNGYDIASPAGTPIVAGWGGQVVNIANWYGTEYGITVLSPEGFRTTYGHLSPLTHVGAWIDPGARLGRVVHDHVDVKMRNLAGGFVDFAHGVPGLGGGGTYTPRGFVSSGGGRRISLTLRIRTSQPHAARLLPPLAGPVWSRRLEAVRAAIAYLRVRHQEASLLEQESPAGALAAVHGQVEEARGRLVLNGVPEDVLLAAFADSDALRQGALCVGDGLSSDGQIEVLDDEAVRRREMARTACQALPQLKVLLRALNAQAPAPRHS